MIPILQLISRYIVLGIVTALGVVAEPHVDTGPIASVPYQEPTEVLPFLFDEVQKMPVEIIEIKKATTTPEKIPVTQPIQTPVTKPATPATPTTPAKTEPIPATNNLDAVVNIMCVETIGNLTRTTTGSGIIISSKGIILTNAHVAIDLMKMDNCSVRSGNIAKSAYKAEILYIPDEWIENNQEYITSGVSRATTGEHDFALLQITGTTNGTRLPASFAYMKHSTGVLKVGDEIETVGYPAERYSIFSSLSSLYRISDETEVKKIYSFGETSSDVFSTGKVSNAEQGSSGGAIVKNDELVGIIANINNGTINALSLGYISNYLEDDSNLSLSAIGK